MEGALYNSLPPPPSAPPPPTGVESNHQHTSTKSGLQNNKNESYKERVKLVGGEADLCHLHLNRLDSILDPLTHSRMPTLTYGIVEFTSAQKGFAGVECAFKKDSVDGDGEEVAEGGEDGGVGI